MAHDAFISYRHGADEALAAAIEHGLERIARPWNRVRAMSVFRDQSDLSAGSDLTKAITDALDSTRYLVLLASPESAASEWVDKEVAHWCDVRNGGDRMIVVVTGGTFTWDDAAGALSADSDAVSDEVRERITTEPLYVDLRWARSTPDLSLRETRFRAAIVLIAATIREIAPADLESEDVRLHRHRRRLARTAVAAVVVLALVASLAAVLAVANARRAERRARDALGSQLGLTALDLPASEVDDALLLSLVAADLDSDQSGERFQASRALIGRYSRLDMLLHAPDGSTSLRSVAISPVDGHIVAAEGTTGSARVLAWAGEDRTSPRVTALPGGVDPVVWFLADGTLLAGAPGSSMVTIAEDGQIGDVLTGVEAVDEQRGLLARQTADGATELIDIGNGAPVATVAAAADTLDLNHGRLAAVFGDQVVSVDGLDGATFRSAPDANSDVSAVAAGPTDDIAVVTASEQEIVSWRITADGLIAGDAVEPPDIVGRPQRLVVAPDGQRLLVVGSDGSAVVALPSGEVEDSELDSTGLVAVDPSGRFAAVGGARLTIWDLSRGRARLATPLPASSMVWSGPCDREPNCRLTTAGESVDVWDPETRRRIELLDQTNAQDVAISDDGASVVTAGWGPTVAVWRLRPIIDDSGRVEVPLTTVTDLAGGTRGLTGAAGGLHLVDTENDVEIALDERCAGDLYAVSPNGGLVVTHRRSDGITTVCSTDDGTMVAHAQILQRSAPVDAVAVDDEGDVALGGGTGFVEQYPRDGDELGNGTAIDVRLGQEPVDVSSLAYRGGTVAAGIRPAATTSATRVFVWPVDAGGTPTQFDTDYSQVPAVALLGEDAEHVVVAGRDGNGGPVILQVWETASRRRLGRALGGLSGDVVSLTGDDSAVVAADADGLAFRWSLDQDPRGEICAMVGRSVSDDEWDTLAGGALRDYAPDPVCEPDGTAAAPVTSTE